MRGSRLAGGRGAGTALVLLSLAGTALGGLVVTREQVSTFFGGAPSKAAWVDAGSKSRIKYVDFSESSLNVRQVCSNAAGDGSNIQISPDGSRVAYDNGSACFVARLEENTGTIHEVGAGINPQWWVHPSTGKEYILMQRGILPGEGKGIYSQEVDADGSPVGSAARLVTEPMANAGRSGDGKFMANVDEEHEACSHGHGMYVLDNPTATEGASIDYWIYVTAEGWSSSSETYKAYCNGSVCPAGPGHTYYGAMLHMGSAHYQIFIRKPDPAYYTTATPVQLGTGGADGGPNCTADDKVVPDFTTPMVEIKDPRFLGLDMRDNHWGYSDWSTHPDYIAATGGTSTSSSGNKNGYFINLTGTPGQPDYALKFAEDGIAQPDLWVQNSSAGIRAPHPARRPVPARASGARSTIVDLRGREVPASMRGRGVYFDPTGAVLLVK